MKKMRNGLRRRILSLVAAVAVLFGSFQIAWATENTVDVEAHAFTLTREQLDSYVEQYQNDTVYQEDLKAALSEIIIYDAVQNILAEQTVIAKIGQDDQNFVLVAAAQDAETGDM